MTSLQKQTIEILIAGGSIANLGSSGLRLRDKDLNPVLRLTNPNFYHFAHRLAVLKKTKKGWVIKPSEINKLHGNNFIKKLYKKCKLESKVNS